MKIELPTVTNYPPDVEPPESQIIEEQTVNSMLKEARRIYDDLKLKAKSIKDKFYNSTGVVPDTVYMSTDLFEGLKPIFDAQKAGINELNFAPYSGPRFQDMAVIEVKDQIKYMQGGIKHLVVDSERSNTVPNSVGPAMVQVSVN